MANKDSSGVRIDKKELKIAGEVVQGLLQKVPTFVLLIFRLSRGMEYRVRISVSLARTCQPSPNYQFSLTSIASLGQGYYCICV